MARRGKWYKQEKWVQKNPSLPVDWWMKYIDVGAKKESTPHNLEPLHEWDFEPVPLHPVQCTHFGCGKTLTLREQLFSLYCIHHQPHNSEEHHQ